MFSELVSVVIPVYNSEKYLEECLNSVLDQTYDNIEIIVIDDGSTDSSPDILKKYSDRVNVISQKNNGLASALNLGISKMKGHWFKWFSPDDVMYPYAIQTLVDEAKNHSSNTILYSNWEIINENGKKLRTFQESNYNELSGFEYNVRLLDGQLINVNTTLIPSYLIKKNLIQDLDDPVVIDYELFLCCALLHHTTFYLISKPLIKYRIHSDQLSHKNITKTMDYISKIKNDILMQLNDSMKIKYIHDLEKYQKTKPPKQKTMEFGMKLLSSVPSWVSDRILIFYLNKIRQNR
ncbi:glycoprotein 3-alpha-L-fucosyltransferase [Marine Group I thaumarchaeote SCGC AAA799-P11]|uniref:Glycoprotein 3-alpha-L-fucosyltransferase n=1 Tax=Marine Group I thaumarchaeote SCGC AAA799-P11 TaxID=1502295 RepID=A0A087S323_9ARCH|nr:glycoprotein 3-alpha-L-fucosyltransferase [Marine Group I thaumarchaeote SCGC AAA799-P11]